jgi:hypothetical protein
MALGGMREWPNRTVSKTVVGVRPPWVQIPLPPPGSPNESEAPLVTKPPPQTSRGLGEGFVVVGAASAGSPSDFA